MPTGDFITGLNWAQGKPVRVFLNPTGSLQKFLESGALSDASDYAPAQRILASPGARHVQTSRLGRCLNPTSANLA